MRQRRQRPKETFKSVFPIDSVCPAAFSSTTTTTAKEAGESRKGKKVGCENCRTLAAAKCLPCQRGENRKISFGKKERSKEWTNSLRTKKSLSLRYGRATEERSERLELATGITYIRYKRKVLFFLSCCGSSRLFRLSMRPAKERQQTKV